MSAEPARARVLVVDDERAIADSLAMILSVKGHAARVAYCAEQAIDIAPAFQPHAMVSDVIMPGMTGLELAAYFAQHFPECKVLLISGNVNTTGLVEEAARRGNHHTVLSKPVHPLEILNFVATCAPSA